MLPACHVGLLAAACGGHGGLPGSGCRLVQPAGITGRRVLSDNGSAYRSGAWRKACKALDFRPIRTKPYTPRTNGKAERFIQTLCREWAYGMSFQNSEERKRWLPRYLRLYNQRRCHMAFSGLSPQQRLAVLLAE